MTKKNLVIDIEELLEKEDVEYRGPNARGYLTLKECPSCEGKRKSYILLEEDEDLKLDKGFFNCFKCGLKGGFEKFYASLKNIDEKEAFKICFVFDKKRDAGDLQFSVKTDEPKTEMSVHDIVKTIKTVDMPIGAVKMTDDLLNFSLENKEKYQAAFDYLTNRGLDIQDIKKFDVHVCPKISLAEAIKELVSKIEIVEERSLDKMKLANMVWDVIKKKYSRVPNELLNLVESLKEEAFEMSRFSERVVFPSLLGNKLIGYIARAYTKDFRGPKVLNSSGPLTSISLTNFNNVSKAEEIVFVEGVFDAVSTGFDRSIPLLGKSISFNQPRFKLLQLTKAKKAVIFPDPGARKEIKSTAESLLRHFKEVRVVSMKNYLSKPISKEDKDIFERVLKGSFEGNKPILSPYNKQLLERVMKVSLELEKPLKNHIFKNIKSRYHTISEREEENLKEMLRAFTTKELEEIKKGSLGVSIIENSFLDASDLGKETCSKLIKEAPPFTHFIDYEEHDC